MRRGCLLSVRNTVLPGDGDDAPQAAQVEHMTLNRRVAETGSKSGSNWRWAGRQGPLLTVGRAI